jgi:hypothetical protein
MATDLCPDRVTTKLREVSKLREQLYMSPARITSRLRRTSQLRRLCLELQRAGKEKGLQEESKTL